MCDVSGMRLWLRLLAWCSFDAGSLIPIGGDGSDNMTVTNVVSLVDTSVTALTSRLTSNRSAQFALTAAYNGSAMHTGSTIEVIIDGAALWMDVHSLTEPPVVFDATSSILELTDLTGGAHSVQVNLQCGCLLCYHS